MDIKTFSKLTPEEQEAVLRQDQEDRDRRSALIKQISNIDPNDLDHSLPHADESIFRWTKKRKND